MKLLEFSRDILFRGNGPFVKGEHTFREVFCWLKTSLGFTKINDEDLKKALGWSRMTPQREQQIKDAIKGAVIPDNLNEDEILKQLVEIIKKSQK